jgi:hypothetical protein
MYPPTRDAISRMAQKSRIPMSEVAELLIVAGLESKQKLSSTFDRSTRALRDNDLVTA